jgi:hypothetical protein
MPVETFNVGEYRRKQVTGSAEPDASAFFDPSNPAVMEEINEAYEAAYKCSVKFLNDNANCVAIIDSTNYNHERRLRLANEVGTHTPSTNGAN